MGKLLANIVEQEYGVFKYMINENLYKHLCQSFPIPFVILNQDYKIIDVNPSFEQLFSILTYEIIFRDFFQVINNYDNDKIRQALEAATGKEPRTLEIFKTIKNEKKILRLSILKVEDEHTSYYGVGIIDVTDQKVKERDLYKKAFYDPLTGLHNRNYFDEVRKDLKHKSSKSLGILLFKIENLKDVNERYSFDEGDRLIHHVAEAMMLTMGTERLTARTSGGEFTVFIYDQNESYMLKKIEDFYCQLDKINSHLVMPIKLSVRMVYREKDWSIDQLIDEVKYKEKDKRYAVKIKNKFRKSK